MRWVREIVHTTLGINKIRYWGRLIFYLSKRSERKDKLDNVHSLKIKAQDTVRRHFSFQQKNHSQSWSVRNITTFMFPEKQDVHLLAKVNLVLEHVKESITGKYISETFRNLRALYSLRAWLRFVPGSISYPRFFLLSICCLIFIVFS